MAKTEALDAIDRAKQTPGALHADGLPIDDAQTATVALVGAMATVANARNQTMTALMHDRLITLAIGTTLAVLPSLAASTWLGPGGTPGLTFQQDPGMLARIDAALRHVESPGLRKAA